MLVYVSLTSLLEVLVTCLVAGRKLVDGEEIVGDTDSRHLGISRPCGFKNNMA